MPDFNGDQLADREKKFKSREAEATAFIKATVAMKRKFSNNATSGAFSSNGRTVWDPYHDETASAHFALPPQAKAVDPFAYYGKAFCASDLVTMALDYLDSTAKPHPIYPKGFAP